MGRYYHILSLQSLCADIQELIITRKKTQQDMAATRRLRRIVMRTVTAMITFALNADVRSPDKAPDNFRDTEAYDKSERIVEALESAISAVGEVYDT